MADIQIEYRNYICELDCDKFDMQCFSGAASDLGCLCFCDGQDHGKQRFSHGSCIHAETKTSYKGVSTKSYEMEEIFDPYSADDYMSVKIGKKYYDCDKVILDGVQIFPEAEKEVQHDHN